MEKPNKSTEIVIELENGSYLLGSYSFQGDYVRVGSSYYNWEEFQTKQLLCLGKSIVKNFRPFNKEELFKSLS